MELLEKVDAAVKSLGLHGTRLAVAVSGGIDSVSLLHALCRCAENHELELSVAHVNHGLRGEESAEDERFVCGLAKALGLLSAVRRSNPKVWREQRSGRERLSLQESARVLRYRALREMALELGAERMATAHQLNDQVETVLLRLFRGTGPEGIGGIPEIGHGGFVVRPFLGVTREEIETYARENRLSWREDSSNASLHYRRNELRTNWISKLQEAFNPRLLNAVAQLAEAQRKDSEWIATLVEREAELRFRVSTDGLWIERGGWSEVPDALARRLARRALCALGRGRDVTGAHLERMVDFWRFGRTGAYIELPGGLVMRCARDHFYLSASGAEAGGVVS